MKDRLLFLIFSGVVLFGAGALAGRLESSSPTECKGSTSCPNGTVKVYLETAGKTSVLNPSGRVCGCLTVAE